MTGEGTSALTLALIAGGLTTLGVLIKIAFDAVVLKRQSEQESVERFADERRQAYDDFLAVVKRQQGYVLALRKLMDRARTGETEFGAEEQAAFPESPMGDLVEALERVRRMARAYSVVVSAEAIVRLFSDVATASRKALEEPEPNDDVTLFLLDRFVEDRVSEFIHGYRQELELKHPKGAPKTWPIPNRKRPASLADSERIVRAHIDRKPRPTDSRFICPLDSP